MVGWRRCGGCKVVQGRPDFGADTEGRVRGCAGPSDGKLVRLMRLLAVCRIGELCFNEQERTLSVNDLYVNEFSMFSAYLFPLLIPRVREFKLVAGARRLPEQPASAIQIAGTGP